MNQRIETKTNAMLSEDHVTEPYVMADGFCRISDPVTGKQGFGIHKTQRFHRGATL